MTIVHICLSSSYTYGMGYQDNLLVKYNLLAGHKVIVISNNAKYENGKLTETEEEDTILEDGSRLIRLKYDRIINSYLSSKIRKTKRLKKLLGTLSPGIIMFHGTASWELLTMAKYKQKNKNTKLYIDSHTDLNNSAKNWVSYFFLHKLFYRYLTRKALPYCEKLFYISEETGIFLKKAYGVPEPFLEFLPLGGEIMDKESKTIVRKEMRDKLNLTEQDILFCHSGKMDVKKKTYELIKIFTKTKQHNFKLLLIGTFTKDIEKQVAPLIKIDDRIIYLGWKTSGELKKYIAATDLYLQPGSQSATMQNALCVGTPVLIDNVPSHQIYNKGNAFLIDDCHEINNIFRRIADAPELLDHMSGIAYELAMEILDYKKLAQKITN
ncbi:MAG: glycosyltransferase [Draconibacterium sp.]